MLNAILAVGILISADVGQDQNTDPTILERIARAGINQVLSFVLDTPASVERIRLDKEQQFLELSNLRIANPKGFQDGHAISVETARLEADIKSLFSDAPLVKLAKVAGVSVNAEMDLKRGLNLKKLLDSTKRLQGPTLPKVSKGSTEKRWRIEKASLENGVVNVNSPLLFQGPKQKKIDKFEMSLMGPDGKGVTANEAMSQILQTLIDKTGLLEGTGAESLLNPLVDVLKK